MNDMLKSVQENMEKMGLSEKETTETSETQETPEKDTQETPEKETQEEPEKETQEEPEKETQEKDDKEAPEKKATKEVKEKTDDKDKGVDIGDKFKTVSYERFKKVNEKMKKLQAERDEFLKNRKDPEFEDEMDKEKYEELKKMGFQSKADTEMSKFELREEQIKDEERRTLDKEIYQLEKDFDGKDGLPKFERDDVLKWGVDNQIYDPKSAYIIMHLNEVVNHFVEKELKAKGGKPNFSKSNETKKPDLSANGKKLSTEDGSLKNHLKDMISGLMSG